LKYIPHEHESLTDKPQKLAFASIELIRSLHKLLIANRLDLQDGLSIAEQKNLKTALEVVVVWGIVPYFLPGVGVPIQKRSKLVTADLLPSRYALGRDCRLLPPVALLHELVMSGSEFSVIISNNYIGDLFAALLQLVYSPAIPPNAPGLPADASSYLISEDIRNQLLEWIRAIHTRVPVQASYPALVMLLSGSSPDWLKKSAGLLLSSTSLSPSCVSKTYPLFVGGLRRPGGVRVMLEHMLESAASEANPIVCHQAASLLSSVPSDTTKEVHRHPFSLLMRQPLSFSQDAYRAIGPQLVDLLTASGPKVETWARVTTLCLSMVLRKDPTAARLYFLQPILRPFSLVQEYVRSSLLSSLPLFSSFHIFSLLC
jgi:hypothetical protein